MPIQAHADYIVSPGVVIGSGNDKIGPWSRTLNASESNTSVTEAAQNVTDGISGNAAIDANNKKITDNNNEINKENNLV